MKKESVMLPACIVKFRELSPQRAEMGNTPFRKAVMDSMQETFKLTVASASTLYNNAFKDVKKNNPELVVGLGRPEDKKGGRKKKVVVEEQQQQQEEQPPQEPQVEQQLYTVVKFSDKSVVAENLTEEQATALVAKAKAAKKAKLEIL